MKKLISFLLLLSLLACNKESETDEILAIWEIDCQLFSNGDNDLLKASLDPILQSLDPDPTANDVIGHKNNLEEFTAELNKKCQYLQFQLSCYACIYTDPPQSEITIFWPDDEIKILDVKTPEGQAMTFVGIHD